MTKVKNEVFIGLLHKKFYLIERELTFGGGANWVGWMEELMFTYCYLKFFQELLSLTFPLPL